MDNTRNILNELEEIGSGQAFRERICEQLENCILFKDFTRDELRALSQYLHGYQLPSGTVLYSEGKKDGFLSFLTSGKIKILKTDAINVHKEIAIVRPGSSLGEMSVIDDFPHSASALTIEDSEIIILTRPNLELITEKLPVLSSKLLWKIAWQLSVRLRQTSGILVDHIN
jgi:CRP-like cAMP-binding protein